jgi:tetratricopeptide (TPR) repeat protein
MQICFLAFGAVTENPDGTPGNIRGNRYLTESLRLQAIAKQAFAAGDYDAALANAESAVQAASMSDLYVGQQVKIYIADSRMNTAFLRLVWADSAEARRHFPSEFYDAKTYYNLGLIAKSARKWDDTIDNANKVIKTLAAFTSPPEDAGLTVETAGAVITDGEPAPPEKLQALPVEDGKEPDRTAPLPARYTVRSWDKNGDCFWNIAGRPWAYGDPRRWPLLYQANRDKIPNPKNPDLIEEGMIMDIPSMNGEERSGLWSPDAAYSPLRK